MPSPLQFHFDFSSPYGYLGAEKIEALASRHGRRVDWRPMLLGVAFKSTGSQPLTTIPLKGDYTKHDVPRSARFHGVPFKMPERFPIATQAPARIVLWQRERGPERCGHLVRTLYRAYFVDNRDIGNPDIAADVAATTGVDREAARAVVDDPVWKDALRREVEAALAKGVFGSPFVIVDRGNGDRGEGPPRAAGSAPSGGSAAAKPQAWGGDTGEPFWGIDRFDQIERWLAEGGF
jgi:2-hydroxychromene-2-carboxylate isomerase